MSSSESSERAQKGLSHVKKFFKKYSHDEESKFRLLTSLKMTSITIITFLMLAGLVSLLLKIDVYFFKANELTGIQNFEETFYEFMFNKLSSSLPYVAGLLVFINITAIYISDILLRPFRVIGDYCERKVNGEEGSYDPDFFTDLKLLTRFSEFFFNLIETAQKDGVIKPKEIPRKYTRIHQPVFETTFFLHYSLFILISFFAVFASAYAFAIDLNEQIIMLANQTLPQNPEVIYFLKHQGSIIEGILYFVLFSHMVMYSFLTTHLYFKVSAPAFGIFATMRSFLKGNYSSRVHLIGFYYLRPQCRKLNKYLDKIEKDLVKKEKS